MHQPLQVPKEYFEKFAPLVHDDKPMYTRQVYVSQVALFPLPLCAPESSKSRVSHMRRCWCFSLCAARDGELRG